jgi:hypothetical protein
MNFVATWIVALEPWLDPGLSEVLLQVVKLDPDIVGSSNSQIISGSKQIVELVESSFCAVCGA